MNRSLVPLVAVFLCLWLVRVTAAQLTKQEVTKGVHFGPESKKRYVVGMEIRAVGGTCQGLYGTIPVPTDWPEQQVSILKEDFTHHVQSVRYRQLANGIEEMHVSIPLLPAGEIAKALVTFDITRSVLKPPADVDLFVAPQRLNRKIRRYLGPSPRIETADRRIRRMAKEIDSDSENVWKSVQAIFDLVRKKVDYQRGSLKGAAAALRDGRGNHEDITSLFIALCRVKGIPARTVWVLDHCYAEFYLHDDEGQGHWIPCQLTEKVSFGGTAEVRPILQKGDRFKISKQRKPVRYVPESLTGKAGVGRPHVTFVRTLTRVD